MGYIYNRMSERAAAAYESGERPLSKWTKDDIIEQIEKEGRTMTKEERRVFDSIEDMEPGTHDQNFNKFKNIIKERAHNGGAHLFQALKRLTTLLLNYGIRKHNTMEWIKKTGAAWLDAMEECGFMGQDIDPLGLMLRGGIRDLLTGRRIPQKVAGELHEHYTQWSDLPLLIKVARWSTKILTNKDPAAIDARAFRAYKDIEAGHQDLRAIMLVAARSQAGYNDDEAAKVWDDIYSGEVEQ